MESVNQKAVGWQDVTELVVLIWVFISPLVLGFFGLNAATIVALSVAAVGSLSSQLGIAKQQPWIEWFNILLALFLALSPWVFGYSAMLQMAMLNAVIAGFVLVVFAVLAMINEYHIAHEHKDELSH